MGVISLLSSALLASFPSSEEEGARRGHKTCVLFVFTADLTGGPWGLWWGLQSVRGDGRVPRGRGGGVSCLFGDSCCGGMLLAGFPRRKKTAQGINFSQASFRSSLCGLKLLNLTEEKLVSGSLGTWLGP